MSHKTNKTSYIFQQLVHHLPFSVFGVMIGLLALGFLTFLAILFAAEARVPQASKELFHVFHAAHVLFSSVASTAMFWKHDRKLFKAVLVGFGGSIVICGASDYLLPYAGGLLMGVDMGLHICVLEEPQLVFTFALVGTLAGLVAPQSFERATEYSHSMHIFVSSVASILYLMAFGMVQWYEMIASVFIVTIVAVMIPCCLSDIVFPLACSHTHCRHPDVLEEDS